jgi:branched-chain amino acid transport system substrate-binding protein
MGDEEHIVKQYNILKEKGVAAIIGSSYSSVTNALAKASLKDGIPIISPTASHPSVTRGRPNVFRAIFIDDYQAEAMAKFALTSLNAKTAVVLYQEETESFKQICETFVKVFEAGGGLVMALEGYSEGDDFADILPKYVFDPPDVIFCPEDFVPAAKLVNTAYELNLTNTKILGTDVWDGLLTYVYLPEAMQNAYYTSPFSFDDSDPIVARFVRDYFDSFSQMPLAGSATAYTCVYILAEAIKTAGSLDAKAIVAAMKTNELDVITGKIKFDKNNNPHINVYIIHIKDATYSTYEKISEGR